LHLMHVTNINHKAMKYRQTTNLLALLMAFLFLVGCQENEDSVLIQEQDSVEASQETEFTNSLEDIDEVVLTGFQRNDFGDRNMIALEEDLCERAIITWLPGEKTMIIDFGEGCSSPRGVIRKGKIIVKYTGRYWAPGTVITTTFDNYYVNERKIEGIRVVKNLGFDENSKSFTFNMVVEAGKMIWPDGSFRTFASRHQKKVYLPSASSDGLRWELTGTTIGKNREGKEFKSEILQSLVFFQRCVASGIRIPSSGILARKLEGKALLTINFGDGTCDREITLSRGDRSKTITLPRD